MFLKVFYNRFFKIVIPEATTDNEIKEVLR